MKKNKICEIDLNESIHEFLDKNAKDLLSKMLEKDPNKRIGASESLKHPYFNQSLQKVPSCENFNFTDE